MSSDVRSLLHDAAIAPSAGPDISGAWRRGRRLRARRLAAAGLVIVAVVAAGSVGVASVLPSGHGTTPAATIATSPVPTAQCPAPSTDPNDVPSWAAPARVPGAIPHVLAPDGNAIAFVFGYPLYSPEAPNRSNKILWIVRQTRDGHPLAVTATLPGSNRRAVHMSFPANSSPGEIYPSDDNVTAPGCWHFALAWNGHRSAVDLAFVPRIPPPVTATTSTTLPTNTTTTTPNTATTVLPTGTADCTTATLTLSLSAPNGSAGHFNYEIAFRNHSAATCVLSGYPGVSFVDSSGRQIGVPAQRNPLSHTPIALAPGATAYAHLAITDPSVLSGCPATAVHQIRVYPPNQTSSALIAATGVSLCARATPATSTIDPIVDTPS